MNPAVGERPASLLPTLLSFVHELRAVGIPVSMVEAIDATSALRHTDLADRAAFKQALAATLVKNARHQGAFDTAFDVFFALHRPPPGESTEGPSMGGSPAGRGGEGSGLADLLEEILAALLQGDQDGLAAAVRRAVELLAGMEPGRPVGGTYYLYRTLRQLDLEALQHRLLEATLDASIDLSDLDRRLAAEDVNRRLEEFKDELRAEIRRRLVADRGREAVARTLRKPLLEDLDLMHATRDDLVDIESAVEPLTRKLAARLAQRRKRQRGGRLDFRKTVRRSLATGGVPLEPVFRAPRPHRPEIFLLCDISGSMATFARFTLQFVYAMSEQFSKLRAFAFIDSIDEITDFFEPGIEFATVMAGITAEADVAWRDGHSDYGHSLEQFVDRYGSSLSPRTTVIIAGDARNNYRPPRSDLLADVAAASRACYWLNPEPKPYWDTGDSVMGAYARYCDGGFEVRNLRQLEAFVEKVALPPKGRSRSVA